MAIRQMGQSGIARSIQMFQNILGNQKIKDKLKKSIDEEKILHSYLFIGIEGIGKKLIANAFAKAIL